MPAFALTPEERRIVDGCRFFGVVAEEVIAMLGLADNERKKAEIYCLYSRAGRSVH